MKKLLVAAIISLSSFSTAALAEIKVGIILGFTGPIESLTPAMRDGAKLAFLEASNSGIIFNGIGQEFKILIGYLLIVIAISPWIGGLALKLKYR